MSQISINESFILRCGSALLKGPEPERIRHWLQQRGFLDHAAFMMVEDLKIDAAQYRLDHRITAFASGENAGHTLNSYFRPLVEKLITQDDKERFEEDRRHAMLQFDRNLRVLGLPADVRLELHHQFTPLSH